MASNKIIDRRSATHQILTALTRARPRLRRALAGDCYQGQASAKAVMAYAGFPLEIVKRSDARKGFPRQLKELFAIRHHLPADHVELQRHDIQLNLCEPDKYLHIKAGESKPKHRYAARQRGRGPGAPGLLLAAEQRVERCAGRGHLLNTPTRPHPGVAAPLPQARRAASKDTLNPL